MSVSCDGGEHQHDTWNLATFIRAADGSWSEQITGFTPETGLRLLPRGPRVFQYIDGDNWIPGPENGTVRVHLESMDLRRRGKFECPHACISPVVIRWERWAEYLEALHQSGVSHLQLKRLAFILRHG